MDAVYLKPNVLAEPLICQWYAWTHLIPPVPAGLNVMDRHLKIMQSFLQAPEAHVSAVREPSLIGGPFMCHGVERVPDVQALYDRTLRDQGEMLALARSVKELDDLLRREARGYSLEPLYNRVPERLRGYVELVYDLNDHPSCRLIEPLLYASPYYRPELQSLALSLLEGDRDRPFVLSTPRVEEPGLLFVERPFAHPGIDELFRMKREPRPYGQIKEMLGVRDEQDELFRTFFTTREPAPYARYTGDAVRTRYFGHACILVETRDVTILADPVISYDYHAELPRYTYGDLPDRIDYVLITHNHQDHVLIETMLQLRHKIGTVVVPHGGGGALQDPSLKLTLQRIGFKNVQEIDDLETIGIEGGGITGVPFFGEHSDLDIRTKMAYLVDLAEGRLLLAADSCNIEPRLYEHVQRIVGDVDILFLGMECDGAPLSWVYGPLITRPLDRRIDRSRRLNGSNYERAVDIVSRFGFSDVYIYAMGMEPWLKYIMAKDYTEESDPIVASNRLLAECENRGIPAERLFGEKEILIQGGRPTTVSACPPWKTATI